MTVRSFLYRTGVAWSDRSSQTLSDRRALSFRSLSSFWRCAGRLASVAAATALGVASTCSAGTLAVRVLDGRDDAPLSGAYVQVGPAPGVPFAANVAFTAADGRVFFDHPSLGADETVTAAAAGFARFSVLDAVTDSVTIRLTRQIPEGGIYGPSAEVSGTVANIAVQNNDSNFDLGFVYPAVQLDNLLRTRSFPIDVPADTVSFPVIGDVVLPGNVVLPTQIEFIFVSFSKPNYHFFVGDDAVYDFVSLAGRIPISALTEPLDQVLNQLVMREIGIERNIAVNGDRTLVINSDLNLTQNLTVNVPEAPNGTTIQAAAVADVPNAFGTRTIYFDLKTGLADTQDSFLLSGRNPSGDLGDALPYIAGSYGDSSAVDEFSAGRIDRAALTLPATRTLGDFFLLPDLTQNGASYEWSDVSRPGITPDPTWAVGNFRLEPATLADSTVTTENLWEVWAAAGTQSLALPTLSGAAPGGFPNIDETPLGDRIVWDHLLSDASGEVQEALDGAIATASRFSRRKVEVTPATTGVPEMNGQVGRELSFRVGPNPVQDVVWIHWDTPVQAGTDVTWTMTAANGRRVALGSFSAAGSATDAIPADVDVPAGVYWIRLRTHAETGLARAVIGMW